MFENTIHLRIGALNIAIDVREAPGISLARPPYESFILNKPGINSDMTIEVLVKSGNDLLCEQVIFDTAYSWRLGALNGGYLYQDKVVKRPDAYLRQAVIDRDFGHAYIYCSQKAIQEKGLLNWIFDVPLGQFLLANLLVKDEGLIIHTCAVRYKDSGFVFMGPSGSGKSTLAGLWRRHCDAVVLSDERIILRKIKNKFWIFGTPWTGSGFAFANDKAPLERLYLIEHAKENFIKPIGAQEAIPVFLTNIRLPLWDKEKAGKTLDLAGEVLSSVEIFRLGFKPTEEILGLIY